MRAIFLEDLNFQGEIQVTGDACHHLSQVVRLTQGEEVLVLDGRGKKIKCLAELISKKLIVLKVIKEELIERSFQLDLVLGIPKREALELSLKQATELGFRKIFLIRSDYSQTKIPEIDRLKSLLINAMEQSNNPFLPEIIETQWQRVPWDQYQYVTMLDSQSNEHKKAIQSLSGENLLIVGPEGGFSPGELEFLRNRPNVTSLHLPTFILRTPTAVAAGAGYILRALMNR